MVEFTPYLNRIKATMNTDQTVIYEQSSKLDSVQVCIPTGAGKGYMMMIDLLDNLINSNGTVFAIASHRLLLNTQHLDDIFEMLLPLAGRVGFVFVGSVNYDISKHQSVGLNQALLNLELAYTDIFSTEGTREGYLNTVQRHIDNNRKVVVITTYHSLERIKDVIIDKIYCDEAHTMATVDERSLFKDNYNKISATKRIFYTATPKDCAVETDSFLMNNNKLFGERIGLSFKHCIDKGYLTRPIIHLARPLDYFEIEDRRYDSVDNMARFIIECFETHRGVLKEASAMPHLIEPKMLIKCANVKEMWELHSLLRLEGVYVCAGASKNHLNNHLHYINDEPISNRSKYLNFIKNMPDDQPAIVLHYDTMSEGINVNGFTSIMFLGGKLQTSTKVMQNIGRSTRLHELDRTRLRDGEIQVGSPGWIKPNCYIIIPYFNRESEFSAREIAKLIVEMREKFGFDPRFITSLGNDIGTGRLDEELDQLNKLVNKQLKKMIKHILHEVEQISNSIVQTAEANRLNSMSKLDVLREKLRGRKPSDD